MLCLCKTLKAFRHLFLYREREGFRLSGRRIYFLALTAVVMVLSMACSRIPSSAGEEIPVVAYIQNAEPEIISTGMVDEQGNPETSVDPASTFLLEVEVRDNNTMLDVETITVVLYSPESTLEDPDSEVDHYTFQWTSAGFSNPGGVGEIMHSSCQTPSEMTAGTGIWIIAARTHRLAREAEEWTVHATVTDEENQSTALSTFDVTGFISLNVEDSQITFSGSPGDTVPADQNPIRMTYTSNRYCKIGCWCTGFVGSEVDTVVIDPSSFSIDDDPYHEETQETGMSPVILSGNRVEIYSGLSPGQEDEEVYVFIDIPQAFLDQDYLGTLSFQIYT